MGSIVCQVDGFDGSQSATTFHWSSDLHVAHLALDGGNCAFVLRLKLGLRSIVCSTFQFGKASLEEKVSTSTQGYDISDLPVEPLALLSQQRSQGFGVLLSVGCRVQERESAERNQASEERLGSSQEQSIMGTE